MAKTRIIKVPIEYLKDFKGDPIIAWQSFGDVPRESEFPYFENRYALHQMVNVDRPNPISVDLEIDPDFVCRDNFYRFMHIDLGHRRDACGISMCHVSDWIHSTVRRRDGTGKVTTEEVESPVFTFDFICQIKPSQFDDDEVVFSDVRELIYKINDRGFPIALITTDRFQSVDTIQQLRLRGFTCGNLSLDRTTTYPVVDMSKKDGFRKESVPPGKFSALSAWLCGKVAINTGRVKLPFYKPVSDTEKNEYDKVKGNYDDFGNLLSKKDFITLAESEALAATYDAKSFKVKEPPRGSIDLLESIVGSIFVANANVTAKEIIESGKDRIRRETQAMLNAQTMHEYDELDNEGDSESGSSSVEGSEFFDGDPFLSGEEGMF